MPDITLDEITPEALKRFQNIYAVSPTETCLVWDSHRLPRFVSQTAPAPVIEDGTVQVAGVGNNDLDPIRDKIRAAGGDHGLVP